MHGCDELPAFFSVPKPWIPPFDAIQMAAVRSWLALGVRVVLLGNETGVAEAARGLNVEHVTDLEYNRWGTPLMHSALHLAQVDTPAGELVCFVNTDIVLGQEFLETVKAVHARFAGFWLMVGKRTDLDVPELAVIAHTPAALLRAAQRTGVDHGWGGIDYLVFPTGTFRLMYPFAIGKFVWDQWLVGNAYRRGLPVVDCSATVPAVHLNGPWWQGQQCITSRDDLERTAEVMQNHAFDYYQKDILAGRTHVARHADGTPRRIVFEVQDELYRPLCPDTDHTVLPPPAWDVRVDLGPTLPDDEPTTAPQTIELSANTYPLLLNAR